MDMSSRKLLKAELERDEFARQTSEPLASYLYEPGSPANHLTAIAAYVTYLADLHGMADADWLRPGTVQPSRTASVDDLRPGRRYVVEWRGRDIGYGVEIGAAQYVYLGVEMSGKHVFRPASGPNIYLFDDEITYLGTVE